MIFDNKKRRKVSEASQAATMAEYFFTKDKSTNQNSSSRTSSVEETNSSVRGPTSRFFKLPQPDDSFPQYDPLGYADLDSAEQRIEEEF